MNETELRARYPNASASFIRRNSPDSFDRPGQCSKSEQTPRDIIADSFGHQKEGSGRYVVRVDDVRKRLLDEDGLIGKFHIDCLRYSGILPSDAPGKTTIEVSQRRCRKGELPHTLIEVYRL